MSTTSSEPGRPVSPIRVPGHKSVVRVWDLGVRLFHWSLVIVVLIAALTGFFGSPDSVGVHLGAGIAIASLLLFRVIWGFSGSTYGRFASFIFSPSAMLARVREIRSGRHIRYLGHNPLGAAMVFALLLVLLAIIATGTVVLGGLLKQGPLAFVTTYATGGLVKEIHQVFAFLLVGMIGLHLAGVAYESLVGKEKLVRAMVTGDKSTLGAVDALTKRPARPFLAVIAFLVLGGAIFATVLNLSARPGLGVPTAAIDPLYEKECGACHFAYHPSMGTAALWTGILNGLSDHFGEDASLPDETRAKLAAYISANSSEHWDTRIAHVLSKPNPEQPLRFTATRFWTRMHHELPDALFAKKPIGFKGNCAACHSDAKKGLFAPQSIDVPEGVHE